MHKIRYTNEAKEDFEKLPPKTAERIIAKMSHYGTQQAPLKFAKHLKNRRFGKFRFRIGDYRVIFDVDNSTKPPTMIVLAIGHRKNIYFRILSTFI